MKHGEPSFSQDALEVTRCSHSPGYFCKILLVSPKFFLNFLIFLQFASNFPILLSLFSFLHSLFLSIHPLCFFPPHLLSKIFRNFQKIRRRKNSSSISLFLLQVLLSLLIFLLLTVSFLLFFFFYSGFPSYARGLCVILKQSFTFPSGDLSSSFMLELSSRGAFLPPLPFPPTKSRPSPGTSCLHRFFVQCCSLIGTVAEQDGHQIIS